MAAIEAENRAVAIINRDEPYSTMTGADSEELGRHLRTALSEARQVKPELLEQYIPGIAGRYRQQ